MRKVALRLDVEAHLKKELRGIAKKISKKYEPVTLSAVARVALKKFVHEFDIKAKMPACTAKTNTTR